MKTLALSLSLALASLAGDARAQVPTLEHSAPVLGRTLTLHVRGAPPGVRLSLFHSPSAGSTATPYGTFELDRPTATLVTVASTDAAGEWSLDVPLPLSPRLAERESHYQALVRDENARAQAVLTNAIALRLVGSRVYVAYAGSAVAPTGPVPGGLQIVSAVDDAVVGVVALGMTPSGLVRPLGDGEPVFSENVSRGALISPRSELVLFDPFFADTLTAIPVEEASRTVHRRGDSVLVLETGYRTFPEPDTHARLHAFELESGAWIGAVDLPALSPGLWATNDDATVAYVSEVGADGRTRVRFVDLVGMRPRGSIAVGNPDHVVFTDLVYAAGQVFTATNDGGAGTTQFGRVTRIDLATGATDLTSVDDACTFEPAPAIGAMLLGCYSFFGFGGDVQSIPLAAPGPVTDYPGLPPGFFVPNVVRAIDTDAWVLDRSGNEPPNGDDPGRLWHLDLGTSTWTMYPTLWFQVGPEAIDVLRDGLAEKVFLATREFWPAGPVLDPALVVIDWPAQTETSLATGPSPYMVKAVGVGP